MSAPSSLAIKHASIPRTKVGEQRTASVMGTTFTVAYSEQPSAGPSFITPKSCIPPQSLSPSATRNASSLFSSPNYPRRYDYPALSNISGKDFNAVYHQPSKYFTDDLGRCLTQHPARLATLPPSCRQAGFTLVEIMVVIVILSIFAGMMSLSVGSSESRKNLAFYEHLVDSLQYVRLISAERMQPMGLALSADKQGQMTPVIVSLSDPYYSYQYVDTANDGGKNAMELSAMSGEQQRQQPSWQLEPSITLPSLPENVSIHINALSAQGGALINSQRSLQPWFVGQQVPEVIWFGTGEATPVTIEIDHNKRPIGEVIVIQPNGRVQVGQHK